MIQVTISQSQQINPISTALAGNCNIDLVDIAITGHAMEAPYGHDIVCAAISTLYEQLKVFFHDSRVTDDGKTAKIHISILDSGDRRMIQSFEFMIDQLSQQYPDNVCLTMVNANGRQG